MEFVAAVGARSFTDTTIPAGSAVVYQVTALRSTRRGEPARFAVRFGSGEADAGAAPLQLAA